MAKSFRIKLTTPAGKLVAHARRQADAYGGMFEGDTRSGKFAGPGFAGEYRIAGETVIVTVTDKPFFASWSLVESTVRRFFA